MAGILPGVQVREVQRLRTIQGVESDIHAFIGTAQWGPDDLARLITSLADYQRRYGGYAGGHITPYAVRGFFEQGGTALYIGRVTGAGAVKSAGSSNALGGAAATLTLNGKYFGEFGNSVIGSCLKTTSKIATITAAIDTQIVLNSVASFEIGDAIKITDGVNTLTTLVVGIDAGAKTIKLADPVGFIFAVGVEVKTVSTHRIKTQVAQVFDPAVDTQLLLVSASGIGVGDIIFLASGDISGNYIFAEVKVTQVNGNLLNVTVLNDDSAVLTEVPVGAFAVSQEFDLTILLGGETVESHPFLNLEDDSDSYVETRLAGSGNQSDYIEAEDDGNVEVVNWRVLQYPNVVSIQLIGGLDGAAPVDDDYLGSNIAKTYPHGIRLLDQTPAVTVFAVPGISTVPVIKGCDQYAAANYMIFVADASLTDDTVEELLDFRNVDLGIRSRFTALYAPWHRERNPLLASALVDLPSSVREVGVFSNVAVTKGIQKAPANEEFFNVVELVANFTDAEHAILNEAGINLIRSFPGRGIRVYGARTLLPGGNRGLEFVSVSRFANFVIRSLREFGTQFTFNAINEVLWAQIEGEVEKFALSLWKAGALYPLSDFSQAYYGQVDASINTPDVVASGKVRGRFAFSPPPPAEQLIFDVFFSAGGVNVNELI